MFYPLSLSCTVCRTPVSIVAFEFSPFGDYRFICHCPCCRDERRFVISAVELTERAMKRAGVVVTEQDKAYLHEAHIKWD